jgi:hypothetical protein
MAKNTKPQPGPARDAADIIRTFDALPPDLQALSPDRDLVPLLRAQLEQQAGTLVPRVGTREAETGRSFQDRMQSGIDPQDG